MEVVLCSRDPAGVGAADDCCLVIFERRARESKRGLLDDGVYQADQSPRV